VQFNQAGSYTVTVSNSKASVVSQPALLTVAAAKVTSAMASPGGFIISVHAQPGVTFIVEATTNLSPSSWQQLASFLNEPVDWSYTDTSATGGQTRFYRLRRVPYVDSIRRKQLSQVSPLGGTPGISEPTGRPGKKPIQRRRSASLRLTGAN
jgi:hypothetical protein